MKRLSVIIPMYKVEPYVERCLLSLEDQDIPEADYEIICVDDGSPDRSADVVKGLMSRYGNIRLIEQVNQGVSVARNNAIRASKGRFLLMIDPDDYVERNTFSGILSRMESDDLDILFLGFEILGIEGKTEWITDYTGQTETVYNGIDGYFIERRKDPRDPDRSWAVLFLAALIRENHLFYPEGVPYLEDGLFLVKSCSVAERVAYHNVAFYKRTTRPGSATNSPLFYSKKAIDGFITAADDLRLFSRTKRFSLQQRGLINHGIVNFVLLSLFPLIRIRAMRQFRETIRKLKESGYSHLDTEGAVEPYQSYAKRYNQSPYLFAIFYSKDFFLKRLKLLFNRQVTALSANRKK